MVMMKIAMLVVALGIAGGIVLWSKSPTVPVSPSAQSISIQDLHALAHLESLPVQQFEDQTFVFVAEAPTPK
jgi:hypothetical protein